MDIEQPRTKVHQASRFRRLRHIFWQNLTRLFWIALILFFTQNAIGSRLENEPRAALLYWMLTAVVVLAGGIVSLNRRINHL